MPFVLTVVSMQIPALSEMPNASFSFAETATPSIRSADVSSGKLVINGSFFGTESSRVNVTLSKTSTTRLRRSLEALIPEEEELDSNDVSELFDADFEPSSDFWRLARGKWRVAGSARANVERGRTSRIKRQVMEDVTPYTCKVILLSDTAIICDTGHVSAGQYDVSVGVEGVGNAVTREDAALVTFVPLVDSVSPEQGSVHGESLLTITGARFTPGDVAVAIDGVPCTLEGQSETSLTCRAPAHSEGLVDVVVTSGGLDTRAASRYFYAVAKTPVIRDVR